MNGMLFQCMPMHWNAFMKCWNSFKCHSMLFGTESTSKNKPFHRRRLLPSSSRDSILGQKKGAVKKRSWLFNQKKCNTVTQQVFNVRSTRYYGIQSEEEKSNGTVYSIRPPSPKNAACFVGPTIYGPKTVHFFCQLLFAGREDGFPPFSAYDIIIFNEQSCTKS